MLDIDPSCPTGNCTFPVFSSLGFCSNCIDITQFVKQNSTCTVDEVEEPESDALDSPDSLVKCIYWLPPFSPSQNYIYIDDDGNTINNSSIALSWTIGDDDYISYNPTSTFKAPWFFTRVLRGEASTLAGEVHLSNGEIIPDSLATIALIKITPLIGSASTGFLNSAHICSLSVCAMEYNVSMESGVPQTEIVSTSYSKFIKHVDPDEPYFGNYIYKFTFSNETNNFKFDSNGSVTWENETVIWENISFTFEDRLYIGLQRLLQGTLMSDYNEFFSQFGWEMTTNIIQYGFNASTNIPKTMDRVAAAMTNQLRDISNVTVQGQSQSMQLHIRVSWWWLLLPILTVIFETILLISVMIITRRHKLPIWKTSELALLFHGIDLSALADRGGGGGGGDSANMLKASEMEDLASALQVRFGRDSEKNILKLERKLGKEEEEEGMMMIIDQHKQV